MLRYAERAMLTATQRPPSRLPRPTVRPSLPLRVPASWKILLGAASLLLLLAIVFARAPYRQQPGTLFVCDGFGYYIYLPSLVIDGDLDLANQLIHQPDQVDQRWYEVNPVTQRRGNCFQVGCAVLWLPFFLLAHGAVTALNALGLNLPRDGFGLAYELPVYIGSFFYGLAGLTYMWRLLRDLWGESVANVTTFYMAAATNLAAYLWFEPDMSHILSMFLISKLFYHLHEIHRDRSLDWRHWARIGVLLGLIALVRAPDVMTGLAALFVGLSLCRPSPLTWRKPAQCVLACAACAIICFFPQMLAWKVLNGGFLTKPPGLYDEIHWLGPDLAGYFLSARRGLFIWTPLLFFACLGAVLGLLRGPRFLQYGALVLALTIYFNSCLAKWWIGASFGERRMVDFAILFALGLGNLLAVRPRLATHRLIHVVGLLICLFNWLLMLRYFTHDLPEYGDVSWHDLFIRTLTYPVRSFQ